MAVQNIVRNVAGVAQTAAGAGSTAAVVVLSDWTNAAGWIAIVEITIEAHGVTSGSTNAYYRREVFEWTLAAATPLDVGPLVAATIIEEDAAWDAVVARNGDNIEVQVTGDLAEIVDWSFDGTVTLQKVS
jgi:hypothetical protein